MRIAKQGEEGVPRKPRIYIDGLTYYITSQAGDQQKLFRDGQDYNTYLSFLKEYKEEYAFKLYSFCLLPNHLHLLIEPKKAKHLSEIMHNLTSRYTKYFNGKYKRSGHLFRGRFKAAAVEKGPYLTEVINYIHHNPFRLKEAFDPQGYLYSSFRLSQGQGDSASFLTGLVEKSEAAESMPFSLPDEQFLQKTHKALQKKKVFGSPEFRQEIEEKLKKSKPKKESGEASKSKEKKFTLAGAGALAGVVLVSGLSIMLITHYSGIIASSASLVSQTFFRAEAPVRELSESGRKDLEGAEFVIEIIDLDSEGNRRVVQKDRLIFREGKFYSQEFNNQGFKPSNYTLTYREDGTIVWETMQSSDEGKAVSWYGEWDGQKVRGVLNRHGFAGQSMSLSFVSKNYSHRGGS